MTSSDDRALLDLARQGDRLAFGKLMRQHQQRVHRLAMHLMGNAGEADDVTQETFLRAFRAIDRFDGRADLFTWLYRICVNVALNVRRQRRRIVTDINDPRVPEPVTESAAHDPGRMAEQTQVYRTLSAAMDALPESLRSTLILACVEGVPYQEIAQVMGCSEGTIAWRVHEARRRLRDALEPESLKALEHVASQASETQTDSHSSPNTSRGARRGRRA